MQVRGETVVGELTGRKLQPLASMTVPWARWKDTHSDTKVMVKGSRENSIFGKAYDRELYRSQHQILNLEIFFNPVHRKELDTRLPGGEVVVTV